MKSWLKQGFIDVFDTCFPSNELQETNEGVPQGGPISPTISNIVFNGIEKCVDLSNLIPPEIPFNERRYCFNYKGKPKICIYNCQDYVAAQKTINRMGLPRSRGGFVLPLLYDTGTVNCGEWSVTPLNCLTKRLEKDVPYFRLTRFADDIVCFVSNEEAYHEGLKQLIPPNTGS
jgi:hypothetical protein